MNADEKITWNYIFLNVKYVQLEWNLSHKSTP